MSGDFIRVALIPDQGTLVRAPFFTHSHPQFHAGLNSAMAATSSAIELQSHKTGSLTHKLQQAVADFGRMRGMLYGDSGPGGVSPEGSAPVSERPLFLLLQAVADFGRMCGMLYGDSGPGGVSPEGGSPVRNLCVCGGG